MARKAARRASSTLVAIVALTGLGICATGAQAAGGGGTAKPPAKGVVSPFVTPTLPDPAFTTDPTLIHGFDVTGFIQGATVNADNTGCPDETDPSRFGGTVTLNNQTITIPCNLVVQMPANTFTWADFVNGGPDLTLGKGSPSFEIQVQGNIVDGKWIAGLAFVSQQSVNSGQGRISSIDYLTGELHIDTGDPANPATVVINDPNGRFGRPQSPDKRFSVDDANPTIHAGTGYPMCVPRVHSDPTLALATEDDPLCPQANRPKPSPTCRDFGQAGITLPASGELTPPVAGQQYCSQFVMPASGATSGPDPTQQAPLEVGDYISYSGTLVSGPNGPYVSAHTIEANVGIYTMPGTQPSYVAIGEFGVGTADPSATAVNGAAQETQDRIFLEAETTDVQTPVDLYMTDVNPTTGAVRNRWISPFEMTGENATGNPSGGITTQNTGAQPQRARIRATKAPTGLLSQPSRMIRVAQRSLCEPAGPDGQAALDACFASAPTFANGLVPGQYAAPVFEFIFPENVRPGDSLVPLDLWHLPFLRYGEGSAKASGMGPSVGPLSPTPWGAPVAAAHATLSPSSVTFADQDIKTTSDPKTITVTDSGDAPLTISAADITGADAGDFAIAGGGDTCTGTTIDPGATCTVDVTFSPNTSGAKQAALRIADNAKDSPQTAALSGTATTPVAPAPITAPADAGTSSTPTTDPGTAMGAATSGATPTGGAATGGATTGTTATASSTTVGAGPLQITDPTTVTAGSTTPITIGAVVPSGASVIQISVFSLPTAAPIAKGAGIRRIARAVHGKRLIATVYRKAKGGRRNTFHLTEAKLRRLRPGRYLIQVRAGATRTSLGRAVGHTLTVRARTKRHG
jgi:hypothetical protein